jgi:hypothetical protein
MVSLLRKIVEVMIPDHIRLDTMERDQVGHREACCMGEGPDWELIEIAYESISMSGLTIGVYNIISVTGVIPVTTVMCPHDKALEILEKTSTKVIKDLEEKHREETQILSDRVAKLEQQVASLLEAQKVGGHGVD